MMVIAGEQQARNEMELTKRSDEANCRPWPRYPLLKQFPEIMAARLSAARQWLRATRVE